MKGKTKLIAIAALLGLAAAAFALVGGGQGKQAVAQPRAALGSSALAARHASGTTTRTATSGPVVKDLIFNGVSPAVSSLPELPVIDGPIKVNDNESLQPMGQQQNENDPVKQEQKGTSKALSAPSQSFDGIGLPSATTNPKLQSSCGCLPPDPNGAVGTTQYVQMVNTDFAVFSKTGSILRGATPINLLWANTTGECKNHNDGDPIVLFDKQARRWLLSQFVAQPTATEQYAECIAISTSSDATGTYYLYEFHFGATFHDYPHFGVWPDAYYMSTHEFTGPASTFAGFGAFAFERAKMLAGKPARVVYFDEGAMTDPAPTFEYGGELPTDLDGKTLPPAGSPNIFASVDDPSSVPGGFTLHLWKFHVDWVRPQNSTFGKAGQPDYDIPVASFVRPQCVYGYGPNCDPQKGTAEGLDTLGDRLMFRLAYRNFGDHESLTLNHTVVGTGTNGIRWYEVRNPFGRKGAPTIYQQGTFAPTDGLWRWMASMAMDRAGNLAIGYSASGPADYPSLRYTGRRASDPLGQLTQGEQVLYTGTGPQTQVEGRWGDYSALTVDPVDDCTFWYTGEYLTTSTVFGRWHTRIGSFKFPDCH